MMTRLLRRPRRLAATIKLFTPASLKVIRQNPASFGVTIVPLLSFSNS